MQAAIDNWNTGLIKEYKEKKMSNDQFKIICPYCGYKELDSSDYVSNVSCEDTFNMTCFQCNKMFQAHYLLTIEWTTEKITLQ